MVTLRNRLEEEGQAILEQRRYAGFRGLESSFRGGRQWSLREGLELRRLWYRKQCGHRRERDKGQRMTLLCLTGRSQDAFKS